VTQKWHGGKGSNTRPRKVSKQKFDDNWDRIFGKKEDADSGRVVLPAHAEGTVSREEAQEAVRKAVEKNK